MKGYNNLCGNDNIYWESNSCEWLVHQPVIRYKTIKHMRANNMLSLEKLEEYLAIDKNSPPWCSANMIC